MADSTTAIFYGYHGLAARTVGVFTCGLYVGSYVVAADGSVTVPYGADTDALFTLARIASYSGVGGWGAVAKKVDAHVGMTDFTYTVPCVVGFAYIPQGKLLRPLAESEIKSSQGGGLAKPRQVHQIGALLDGTIGVSFGPAFDLMTAAVLTDAAGAPLTHAAMFSGVHQMSIIPDRQKYDCELCWQVNGPYPCTIVSLTGFLHTEER